ncbi:Cyclin [Parasponia andersonii]|uniref:B-like cyclin n=1 Tax=Parasponia andersonii TaxID=3476 RepID=A0A2P5DLF9_PARAD|nr:Cyclin [Parasponia andersonii]
MFGLPVQRPNDETSRSVTVSDLSRSPRKPVPLTAINPKRKSVSQNIAKGRIGGKKKKKKKTKGFDRTVVIVRSENPRTERVAIENAKGGGGGGGGSSRLQVFLSSLFSSIGGVFSGVIVQEQDSDMATRAHLVVPHQQLLKEGGRQKNVPAERRNRRVLKDIGNLVNGRVPEGKPHDQKPQVEKKNTEPTIEEHAATAKRDDQKKEDENSKPVSGRRLKEGLTRKNSRTFTSTLSARSKAACGLINKPKEQIVNIDAKDAENELAVVEYIDELYSFYKLSEDETKVNDYMGLQTDINAKMRSILVDWLVEVHHKFELMPETLYLTINIVDRFLSMKVVPRRELQLVGISSMLLACKYEEIWAPEVNDFVCISDNAYVKEQILIMEKAILGKLGWHLTVPTPYVFLVRYIKASVPTDVELENMVFFLAELGQMHYSAIISYSPSTIAASAVYAARCTLDRSPFWTETLEHHTGYSEVQLMDCAKLLASFHSGAAESKLKAVFKKYSGTKSGAVALHVPAKELLPESP